MTSTTNETEEAEIYKIISDALLCLCEQKPNDPVDFLSRKMLELIGDDPSNAVRKKADAEVLAKAKTIEDIIISPETLALTNLNNKFDDCYRIINQISSRHFLVEDLKMGGDDKVATIIDKNDKNYVMLSDNRIKMLVGLDNVNINKVYQILVDDMYIYIIEDYCKGKDLFQYLTSNTKNITEDIIKMILTQLLSAVNYIHQKGIIHKGITPLNILIYQDNLENNEINIKLSDFISNSEYYTKFEFSHGSYGKRIRRIRYVAPEFIEGKYDHKCDIWSIGIIAYVLITGKPPFTGNDNELLFQISHKKMQFPDFLTDTQRQFLERMLSINPNNRSEALDLINDPYLKQGESDVNPEETVKVLNDMAQFAIGQNLRRSVLSYMISRKLYDEKNIQLQKTFGAMDVNHDGHIDCHEIYKHYRNYFPGTSKEQWARIKKFIDNADINKDGKISYSEFLATSSMASQEMNKDALREVFNYFDVDKCGEITSTDIKELFEGTDITDEEIHNMLDDIDKDENRKVSFEEFCEMISKHS